MSLKHLISGRNILEEQENLGYPAFLMPFIEGGKLDKVSPLFYRPAPLDRVVYVNS